MSRCRFAFAYVLLALLSVLGCGDEWNYGSNSDSNRKYSVLSDNSFTVGDSAVLEVENFAGSVDVRSGDSGTVHIVAEKWAGNIEDLDQIKLNMVLLQNGVRVVASNPDKLLGVSVDFEITVPPDMQMTILNAAGTLNYHGPAKGESHFSVAAGNIKIELPAEVNVEVFLSVAAGSINVAFPVDGQVEEHVVDGVIGTGADGRIEAQVGAGSINVVRQ